MSKCSTFRCKREVLEGEDSCAGCVVEIERHYGRAGFDPHGRPPSALYQRAIEALKEEDRRRIV